MTRQYKVEKVSAVLFLVFAILITLSLVPFTNSKAEENDSNCAYYEEGGVQYKIETKSLEDGSFETIITNLETEETQSFAFE